MSDKAAAECSVKFKEETPQVLAKSWTMTSQHDKSAQHDRTETNSNEV